MLELVEYKKSTWTPPKLEYEELAKHLSEVSFEEGTDTDWLVILKIKPYIDSAFVRFNNDDKQTPALIKRFVFREDYSWDYEGVDFFVNNCLNNDKCGITYQALTPIYKEYSSKYPDWKLKRYYTKPFKMLDHIYNCMRKNTAKEMLYKAGLDELAFNITDLDELNLLATRPSDIYDGVSMRTLRALNCREGSLLLSTEKNRNYIKELQVKYSRMFKQTLNNAQSKYLKNLIEDELTIDEVGRLFQFRATYLMNAWNPFQYEIFIKQEKQEENLKALAKLDPYYEKYIKEETNNKLLRSYKMNTLFHFLIHNRKEYDKKFRNSNKKRNSDWQESDNGYVIRYPQTIDDFCREAVYMKNCLLTYVDAVVDNKTTILFMRKNDDVDTPFITIEISRGELAQAYRRFNYDCSKKEAEWIRDYCRRHNIGCDNFKFNIEEDNEALM